MHLEILIPIALLFFCCSNYAYASHPGLRVALAQMDVVDGNVKENMNRAEEAIRKAAAEKADMVCLPEAVDF